MDVPARASWFPESLFFFLPKDMRRRAHSREPRHISRTQYVTFMLIVNAPVTIAWRGLSASFADKT
jgi:hypothetical protein